MSAFDGFPQQTSHFLNDLTNNNTKVWFDDNRGRYEDYFLTPAKAFVVALGEKLQAMDTELVAIPAVNKSIFRINRDVRFAKDKTPYKNHLDIAFYTDGKRAAGGSGYFYRMFSDRLILGAGLHMPTPDNIALFREAVNNDKTGKTLQVLVNDLTNAGYVFGNDAYKRIPQGYDADHPRASLLKLKSLHASIETALPAEIRSAEFGDWCTEHCQRLLPLHQWLVDNVTF